MKLEHSKEKTAKQTRPKEQFLQLDQERIQGNWEGILRVSGTELRLVFRFSIESDGFIKYTIDSPDQGATGIHSDIKELTDKSIKIGVKSIGGSFEGTFKEEGLEIIGEWIQGGQSWPLIFTKVKDVLEVRRPQIPKQPYPYNEENVSFKNYIANINLAGTLTVPYSDATYPSVILISGSGKHDRDALMFGHRPFLVLSDYLTRQGIAVLRVDDRGFGQSDGNFFTATSEDFANDVIAGIEFLKPHPKIDPNQIGLIGHSEGGLIAAMVAVRSSDIAYIVMMAGPGIKSEIVFKKESDKIIYMFQDNYNIYIIMICSFCITTK